MAYRSIHIPFYTGQDESVDVKLLPMGPMRAVHNMQLERDGRMVRRNRLLKKGVNNSTGELVSERLVEFAEPNSIVTRRDDAETRVHHWINSEADETEILNLEGGVLPLFSSTEHFHSNLDVSGDNEGAGDDRSQLQPQSVIDINGNIITSFIQGALVVIEFREPRDLQVFNRIEYDLDPSKFATPNNLVATVKIVASKMSPKIAVVYWLANGLSFALKTFVIDVNDYTISPELFVESDGVSTFPKLFDVAERPDEDSFILTHSATSTGWILSEYNFSDSSFIRDLDSATVVPTFGDASTGVYATAGRWYWGYTDSDYDTSITGGTLTLKSGAWNGGTITSHVIDSLTLPSSGVVTGDWWPSGTDSSPITGVMFTEDSDSGKIIVTFNQTPFDTQELLWTGAYYAEWDISANTVVYNHRYGELLITAPVGYSQDGGASRTYHSLSEGAYYSRDDTDDNFEPSSPASILSWRQAGESDSTNLNSMITGGAVVVAGCRYLGSSIRSTQGARYFFNDRTMPKPVQYTVGGEERCIWPVQLENGRASTTDRGDFIKTWESTWVMTRIGGNKPKSLRDRETLFPNAALSVSDGVRVISIYTGPPNFLSIGTSTAAGFVADGDYIFAFVFEYRDANGRLHRSDPSVTRTITATGGGTSILFFNVIVPAGIAGQGNGALLVAYVSNKDGTILFRRTTQAVLPGQRARHTFDRIDDSPAGAETIYTQQGEVPNNPAPSCKFITGTRNRIWAGGLITRSVIQASKPLNDLEGVKWNGLDNYKVFFPDDVTGMAPMDDSLVVFTKDRVYAVHGAGPDSGGVGVFTEPQVIPGTSGCINSKSVVGTEIGIFYQSVRGIELIPRGFGSPQWIGEPVRDTIGDFPICMGVSQAPKDWTVRWLFHNSAGTLSRTVIWDQRARSWYVHSHVAGQLSFDVIGTCTGKPGAPDDDNMLLGTFVTNTNSFIEDDTVGREALSSTVSFLETGSLRVFGLNGWGFGRDVFVLGEFGGRACTVTLAFAFNDQEFLDKDFISWNINTDTYFVGEPIELGVTLPVQQFSAVQFKLTITALNDDEDSLYTFKSNGLSLYYTPAPEGPRLPARQRG